MKPIQRSLRLARLPNITTLIKEELNLEFLELAHKSILDLDSEAAVQIAQEAIAQGVDPMELMTKGFVPGIVAVGDLFERGKLFLPELVIAARAMEKASNVVNKAFNGKDSSKVGVAVIGTVKGDNHDIGKSIVVSLFQANGLEVYDIGRDKPTHAFIEKALEVNADIIGTSALLTTTMQEQKKLEDELRRQGIRNRFITIVGGAPITERWAKRIGADAYAENAIDGVNKAIKLIQERKA